MDGICDEQDCPNKVYARGKCNRHFRLLRIEERAAEGDTCSEPGCDRGFWAKGKCRRHYMREYMAEYRRKSREVAVSNAEEVDGGSYS